MSEYSYTLTVDEIADGGGVKINIEKEQTPGGGAYYTVVANDRKWNFRADCSRGWETMQTHTQRRQGFLIALSLLNMPYRHFKGAQVMYKTKYLSEKERRRIGIDLSQFPSAGPNPCVSGMKKLYWGKDALCVRSGAYVYKVSADVYAAAH